MSEAQPGRIEAPVAAQDADAMVNMRFKVPKGWKLEFEEIAKERAISMADLLRQMMREFMRNRRDT